MISHSFDEPADKMYIFITKDRSESPSRGGTISENRNDSNTEKQEIKGRSIEMERLEKAKKEEQLLKRKQAAESEAQKRAEEQAKMKAEAKAKAEAIARAKAEAEAEAKAKSREQWISGALSSPGMPKGWEKKLDHTTGTYKYIDHNTGQVHTQAPQSLFGSPGKLFLLLHTPDLFRLRQKHLQCTFCPENVIKNKYFTQPNKKSPRPS